MRILELAKELGISYERLIDWMKTAKIPCSHPDEEMDADQERKVRLAFSSLNRGKKKAAGDDSISMEDILGETASGGIELTDFDLPDSLEELEALEQAMTKVPARRKQKSDPKRILTSTVLDRYGIRGKAVLKKLRKLLSEPMVRLLNQQDLSEDQHAELCEEIEFRAVLFCDHPFCTRILSERNSPESLIPVRNAGLCRLCGGSTIRRSLQELAESCRKSGIERILVVGGAPASHNEIRTMGPDDVTFRLVAGDVERNRQRVSADLRWSQLAVIWGGTILGHSVSSGYTGKSGPGSPVILRLNRRSVEALCAEVVLHLDRLRKKKK